jgi:hypothetical protein
MSVNRESSVGIATGYGQDDWGSRVLRELGIFLFTTASRTALGSTQPPIQWVPGAKRPGREACHSHPTSAEGKNARSYTSTPQYVFMAWENFTFTLTLWVA